MPADGGGGPRRADPTRGTLTPRQMRPWVVAILKLMDCTPQVFPTLRASSWGYKARSRPLLDMLAPMVPSSATTQGQTPERGIRTVPSVRMHGWELPCAAPQPGLRHQPDLTLGPRVQAPHTVGCECSWGSWTGGRTCEPRLRP